MSLELANRSIQYLWGIVENVLIKIDKFILPIDFVILDMREDSKIPIILGRPFLATARAMIDVFNKKITLRVRNEEESIDISDLESCGKADDSFESRTPIRRIEQVNTPYSESQETKKPDKTQNEHLYSASANEIKEKRPVLKDLPSHLEYAYLKGDESCPSNGKSYSVVQKKGGMNVVLNDKNDLIRHAQLQDGAVVHSDYLGAVLGQRIDGKFKPIYYASKTLNDAQAHYTTTEKELLAVIKKGAENLAEDHLSRLKNPNIGELPEEEITDKFLDDHLMILKAKFNDKEP
ncbi:reverse transcriptase domain-containing protein, partial [Tanacetum coccineum]